VIQTHGFPQHEFRADGVFPTAFAARELAAAGILVLQSMECPIEVTPEEGPCNVEGYEAAVGRLIADGFADANRVGIIGFSRTCYHVLEALTHGNVPFRAASITDGVDEGYLQYIVNLDSHGNMIAHEADAMIGARPFGHGLQQWLLRSPEFGMDKVTAALQVVALGRSGVLSMWEPYAALRYLGKPVELTVIDDDEHVLRNPAARLTSQGGTVDWFRFWLQDYEDPDPTKVALYQRWRELRRLRSADKQQQVNLSIH
jgi:hypothetical protein